MGKIIKRKKKPAIKTVAKIKKIRISEKKSPEINTEELIKKVKEILVKKITLTPGNKFVVNLSFQGKKRADYLIYIKNVVNKVDGNIDFPVPDPDLDVIRDMIVLESKARSNEEFINADKYMKDLKALMKKLCIYIGKNCGNSRKKLRSTGVHENKTTRVRIQPGPPELSGCKDGKKSGQAIAKIKKHVPGNQGYIGRYRDMSGKVPGDWIYGASSNGMKMTFKKLPLGILIEIEVCAKGTITDSGWSNKLDWRAR